MFATKIGSSPSQMPAPRVGAVLTGVAAMERLKKQGASPPKPVYGPDERDEFGRLIAFTGDGFKEAGDMITYAKKTGAFDQAGSIISYGKSSIPPKEPLPDYSPKKYVFGMDEATLPGDLLLRKSSLPIKSRMAALIRQRSLDMALLIMDFLKRPGFSRLPQRGFAFVDIPTFRRCLCYAFGEQWGILAMTSPEFLETYAPRTSFSPPLALCSLLSSHATIPFLLLCSYSPYIVREQTESGDALVSWKAWATDIMKTAGVDKGDLGYLKAEADLDERVSVTKQEQDDLTEEQKAELQKVIDAEFSHDIETEEEKQHEVLKDVERVTGARSVAVTRYGSYESKLHGRNQAGAIKQGDFERIGGHGDYREEQGISADGTHIKTMNTQIAGQSHEYAADGTTIVDDGSADYQVTQLKYNHKAAASASQYTADKMKSIGKTGALSNTDAVAASRAAMAAKEAEKQAKLGQQYQQMMKARGPDRFVR